MEDADNQWNHRDMPPACLIFKKESNEGNDTIGKKMATVALV